MELDGRRILLTGSASGIGRALLKQLAAFDAQILAVDRDSASNEEAVWEAARGRARISPFARDLGTKDGVDAAFAEAMRTMGGVDLLFANAGFAYYEELPGPDWEHIEAIFRTNVIGPIYAVQKMRELNGGAPFEVVLTASAMSFVSVPGYALYGATKAALDRFAEAVRYELAPQEKVTVVYPIATRTRFFQNAGNGDGVLWPNQRPEQVARAIVRGVRRGRTEIFPSLTFRILKRRQSWLFRIYRRSEAKRLRRTLLSRQVHAREGDGEPRSPLSSAATDRPSP